MERANLQLSAICALLIDISQANGLIQVGWLPRLFQQAVEAVLPFIFLLLIWISTQMSAFIKKLLALYVD